MKEHGDRRTIIEEMHLRKWGPLVAPMQVTQLLKLVPDAERDLELALITNPPAGKIEREQPRHVSGMVADGVPFIWERHSEASSLAIFIKGASPEQVRDAVAWAEAMPGDVLRATCIRIVEDETRAEELLPSFSFREDELVSCHLYGSIRIWSDFRIGEDAYGRLLIAANGVHPRDLSRVAQRLQELGNYRNLALLGLPSAREGWRLLDEADRKLMQLGQKMATKNAKDDELLEELSRLSLDIGSVTNIANYRLSATAAYAELVEERLAELEPEPISGYQSLTDFTQRRFLPAIRTCASFANRSRQLRGLASQLSALLRTRIETRIENQNGKLLASLERSASRQLRLQQLVEGFSVLAISYYAIGLIGHFMEGISEITQWHGVSMILSAITPLVVALTWIILHRIRRTAMSREHPTDHKQVPKSGSGMHREALWET